MDSDPDDPYNPEAYLGFKYSLCVANMLMTVTLVISVLLLIKRVSLKMIDWAARLTISIYLTGSILKFASWVQFLATKRIPEDHS